jgi:uncharacterized protein (UPF0335 family)
MTNSDLRHRAEHIGRLMDQRDDITDDIKGAFEAAKSVGFNAAALRKAIAIARMDSAKRAKHDSGQMDIELYLAELEGRQMEAA